MNPIKNSNSVPAALDRLIDEITVDAYGDNEQLWTFRQAFEDEVYLPADGFVIRPDALAQSVGQPGRSFSDR